MIIKKSVYKKVKRIVDEEFTPDVFGCDECRKELKEKEPKLGLSIHYHDKSLAKNEYCEGYDNLHFCSWKCVLKHLPKIKTDYFVSLPFLHYDEIGSGLGAIDLFKLIKKQ